MADDGKHTEVISCRITERMALDLLRLGVARDRSVSDLLYVALRRYLYGEIVRLDDIASQSPKVDKVNRGDE